MNDIKKEKYNYKPQRQACYLRNKSTLLKYNHNYYHQKRQAILQEKRSTIQKTRNESAHIWKIIFKTINNNTESITILEEQTKKWKICKDLLYILVVSCH